MNTYKEILEFNNILSKLSFTKDYPVQSMIKLIDLKDEIKKEIDKHIKVFQEITSQYSIKEQGNSFNWSGHPEEKQISKKIDELFTSKVELKNLNFLDSETFVKTIPEKGLNLDEISICSSFLRKKGK